MPHRIMPFWGGWEIRTFELFKEFQVGSNVFRSGMKPDEYPFYAYAPVVDGVAQFENARFYIDKDGNLKATNAEIEGKIVAGAGSEIDWSYIKNVLVQTAQIADAAITTAKIADLAVTEAKIANASIGTAKIKDASITTAKIADLAVTDAKIESLNVDKLVGDEIIGKSIKTGTGDRVELYRSDDPMYPNTLRWVSSLGEELATIKMSGWAAGMALEITADLLRIWSDIEVDGFLVPVATGEKDLGLSSYRWRNLYLSGNIYVDGLVDGVDISAFKSSFDTHKSTHYSSGGDLYVPTDIRNVHYLYFSSTYGRIIWGSDIIFDFEAAEIEVYKNLKPIGTDKSLGYSDAKWSDLWVVNLHTGDIDLGNNFKIKEEGEDKIAFYNPKGDKVMVLDKKGNLYLKGQVKQL